MSTPTEPNMQIIENASRDDVCTGDRIIWERAWEREGVTYLERCEGIACYRDSDGDWRTAEGRFVTDGERVGTTITIRRTVQELPTEDGAVVIPADGHDYIEARVYNKTYRAREAVRHWTGGWHAAWRSGPEVRGVVAPEDITPGTWKVDDQ